jgi:hypothetical protein
MILSTMDFIIEQVAQNKSSLVLPN